MDMALRKGERVVMETGKTYEPSTRTLGAILEDKARKNVEKPLVYFEDRAVSYEELNEGANKVAQAFLNMGIGKGSKVCMILPNCIDFLHILCGLSKLGVVTVPLNTAHKGIILQYMINHSDATIIVADKRYLDSIKFIENELTNVTTLIAHPDKEGIPKFRFDTYSYQGLLANQAQLPAVDIKLSDPFVMIFTSGTTGPSKAVMWPHNQVIWMAEQWAKGMRVTPNDVYYSWTPLFHIIGLDWFTTALLADAAIAIVERFSLHRFWDDIRKYKATITALLPMAMELLYRQPEKEDDAANSLRAIQAGPIPKRIHRAFEKRFGVVLVNDYGLTEFDPIALSDYDDTRVGSCGKGQEDVEVKIFDEDDNEVPSNVVGELVARPLLKPYIMMTGYYKMPEKTVEAWRNLWFHTGDLAYKDEDGFIYFVDRKKEAIRRRGENVSSMELEHIIGTHPSVAECAVVAVPAELGEDDIKAVIRVREGALLSPEELLQFCEDRMAFFMVPRYVEFVEEFPRTETLRIKKDGLKGITDRTWDREKAGYKLKRR
jgi:crotonobetaine/carnitine-CoA ligase